MQKKNKVFLSATLLLSVGVILVVAVFIVLNQPGKPEKITATGLVSSSEPQIVYPAPNSAFAVQTDNKQSVYPPPSTVGVLPTITAIPVKAVAFPTVEQGILTIENVQRTSLNDAKAAYDENKAIFLDVRTSESYARNHVPGSVSIPEAQINERMKELDPNQWIIAYCS
jgi:hypothetical protein